MRWRSPTINKYFQMRRIWHSPDHSPSWNSGTVAEVVEGTYVGTDSPKSVDDGGDLYTLAWYAYFYMNARAYDLVDEDPSDENIYLSITIRTVHNCVWSNTETDKTENFNDIAVLVWTTSNKQPYDIEEDMPILLGDYEAAVDQLYNWAGIDGGNVVCGCVGDIGAQESMTTPGGSWGQHAGTDTAWPDVEDKSFTLTFPPSAFNADGSLKDEYKILPFVFAKRSREPSDAEAILEVERTVTIDLNIDPGMSYIPWAIRKQGSYVSCNRLADGLTLRKNGSFAKVVKNSAVSSKPDGQRVQGNRWIASPITPEN